MKLFVVKDTKLLSKKIKYTEQEREQSISVSTSLLL